MSGEGYFTVVSAILFGMATGYGMCALMRIEGRGAIAMVSMLLLMSYSAPRIGPMFLVDAALPNTTGEAE